MKKNLILAVAFLFAVKLATAQTEKGTQNLGLNLSVAHQNLNGTELNTSDNSYNLTSNKQTQLSIGPSYSYFIANKLDLGVNLNYSHFTADASPNYSPEKQTQNIFSGNIFLRKYFMCSDKFGFRAGPYAGYGYTKSDYAYSTYYPGELENSTEHGIYGGIKLDLVYYPAKHLGLSATLANAQYEHDKVKNGDLGSTSINNYSLALITNGVGVSVFYVF